MERNGTTIIIAIIIIIVIIWKFCYSALQKGSEAGTSTAIADNKPKTESTPKKKKKKKPPQEGTKTMGTKSASRKKVLQDLDPKPGGFKIESWDIQKYPVSHILYIWRDEIYLANLS